MFFPIHVAVIQPKRYLLLRKRETELFHWFLTSPEFEKEEETQTQGTSCAEAIRLIHCGFRYTLPERDQVGSNALFWQMALSYNSPNGRYFDEEVGHLCYVDFASQEALEIWQKLRASAAMNV